jgi:hypothetical protein
MSEPLAIYLHDHLGGAKAAIDLLHAMRERKQNHSLGEFAARIVVEVEADRDTLRGLADKIGSGSSVIKEFSGWFSEKVTRLKLGEGAGGDFGEFEALEFLALGVLGKRGLWQALDVTSASDQRLHGYDFKQLANRAEMQHAEIERHRLQLAKSALPRTT